MEPEEDAPSAVGGLLKPASLVVPGRGALLEPRCEEGPKFDHLVNDTAQVQPRRAAVGLMPSVGGPSQCVRSVQTCNKRVLAPERRPVEPCAIKPCFCSFRTFGP